MTNTFFFYNMSFAEVNNLTAPGKKFWDGDMDWFILNRIFGPENCYEGKNKVWRVKMELEAL